MRSKLLKKKKEKQANCGIWLKRKDKVNRIIIIMVKYTNVLYIKRKQRWVKKKALLCLNCW